MPKRTKKTRYIKKGGDITQGPPLGLASPVQAPPLGQAPPSAFSTWFNDAKKAVSSAASSVSSAASSATSTLQNTVSPPQQTLGGKRRQKGGTSKSYFSLTNLASVASPISGILTAKPQIWVGGKTRKRSCQKRHKHTKLCKARTYKKSNRTKRVTKSKFPFSESLKRLIKM
jgi:hypothetical protein